MENNKKNLKNKTTNIKTIESFSPSNPKEIKPFRTKFRMSGQIDHSISKHKDPQTGKEYFIKGHFSSKRKSRQYDTCYDFKDGSAMVVDKSKNRKYYIDQDFCPIVCEEKVNNSTDLVILIKGNIWGLVKYVSPQKMYSIYKDAQFFSVVPGYCKADELSSLVKEIKTIKEFLTAYQIELPVENKQITQNPMASAQNKEISTENNESNIQNPEVGTQSN